MTVAECFFLAVWEVLKFMFQPQFVIPAVVLGAVVGVLTYFQLKKEMENDESVQGS